MRPNIEEQLDGTCRILEQVVAPAVKDPYATDILRALVSNLRMLGSALPALPEFLLWDNDTTLGLIESVSATLPPESAERAAAEVSQLPAHSPRLDTLNERNEKLRAILTDIIRGGSLGADWETRLMNHLQQRSARSPIRFATALPSASKG